MNNKHFLSAIPAIRDHYSAIVDLIMHKSQTTPRRWVDPYTSSIDWASMFSPIEEYTWNAIRSFGKIPMYPQYPVLQYFVDFGNPYLKVAIECDGEQYHQDADKEELRESRLEKAGWTVFRISGSDCMKIQDRYFDDEDEVIEIKKKFFLKTIDGLIYALAIFYCDFIPFSDRLDDIYWAAKCLRKRVKTNIDEVMELTEKIPGAESWYNMYNNE